jgi:hypothetical protein
MPEITQGQRIFRCAPLSCRFLGLTYTRSQWVLPTRANGPRPIQILSLGVCVCVCPYLDAPNRRNGVMLEERGHIYLSRGFVFHLGLKS